MWSHLEWESCERAGDKKLWCKEKEGTSELLKSSDQAQADYRPRVLRQGHAAFCKPWSHPHPQAADTRWMQLEHRTSGQI